MATLADLFTSYKNVEPEETETQATDDTSVINPTIKSRLQQIAEAFSTSSELAPEEEAPVEDDEIFGVEDEEPEEQPTLDDEFTWYTTGVSKPKPKVKPTSSTTATETETLGYSPKGAVTRYRRGNLDKEIKALFEKNGINIRVTSGRRPGAVTKQGRKSNHADGNAVDIVPGNGETFSSIKQKIVRNPEILQFFHENGLGIIDETTAEAMRKTGASGKHFHVGPDSWATKTWASWTSNVSGASATPSTQQEWARNVYTAFARGLKDTYGSQYSNSTYNRIARYMTYQAALESGYGKTANGFNYSGHMRNNKTIHYNTMDEFVKAHIKTLKKWDFMDSTSLQDYINRLHTGPYKYCASEPPSQYYREVSGTQNRVNRYLGLSAKQGGKFQNIRELYEQSFS